MVTMTNGFNATHEFKKLYNDLILHTFGFSFDTWHSKNVWDDDYECYSIIENGIMIANVSVYKMQLLLKGEECDYMQIGAVATRQEHRGKGLSKKIFDYIFEKYPHLPSFLIANDSVLGFYPKLGYAVSADIQPYIEYKLENLCEMKKLNISDPRIDMYLKGRNQFSRVFDCKNQYSVNWFHLIYTYSDDIYEVPELGLMLVAAKYGSILKIFDIAALRKVSFPQLAKHLSFTGIDTIEFGFNPDWLDIDYKTRSYTTEDATLFVKGDFGLGSGYVLPTMIKT